MADIIMSRAQRRQKQRIFKQASESLLKLEQALGDMEQFLVENNILINNLKERTRSITIRNTLRTQWKPAPLSDAIAAFNHMREDA
jgi:hypothetical protein